MKPQPQSPLSLRLAFMGGGNMASAIIGGLVASGLAGSHIDVVDPNPEQGQRLHEQFGVTPHTAAGEFLSTADVVVWAVKPQVFKEAAAMTAPWVKKALHLSVAAGIRTDSMAQWLGTARIVRTMPNTPALVGKGTTGLFATHGVNEEDKAVVTQVLQATGRLIWVTRETDLDTVTALSGSGPAYVFYFLEAMQQAGVSLGLDAKTALDLGIGTFLGAAHLAEQSPESPEVLRERVTSKGGTTYAALSHMEATGVKQHLMDAMHAAHRRAGELGDEFGK